VTLILNFDLALKKFNLGYIFSTKCAMALIHEIWMDDEKTFFGTTTFDLVILILNFDLVLKKTLT
jgi:hypothetical protein